MRAVVTPEVALQALFHDWHVHPRTRGLRPPPCPAPAADPHLGETQPCQAEHLPLRGRGGTGLSELQPRRGMVNGRATHRARLLDDQLRRQRVTLEEVRAAARSAGAPADSRTSKRAPVRGACWYSRHPGHSPGWRGARSSRIMTLARAAGTPAVRSPGIGSTAGAITFTASWGLARPRIRLRRGR